MTKELQLPGKAQAGKHRQTILIAGIVILGVLAAAFLGSLLLRVDEAEAREIALSAVGGGQVIGQSVDREGLWNEYSFRISNNGTWYEVEVDGFGTVTELESDWDREDWHWD